MPSRKITAPKATRRSADARPHQTSDHHLSGFIWTIPIVAAGLLAYANCFRGEFLMDDYLSIVNNDAIRSLVPLKAFIRDTRPVTDFTFALNYAVWGLDRFALHAANLAIHIAGALLLFGIARRTLSSPRIHQSKQTSNRLACAIAVLWVVHPLTTQAVTYLVQRGESLMSFFYLAVLYCLIRGSQSSRSAVWYALCVIACALGMGSKAVMVTAPVVALIYDAIFIGGSVPKSLRARWPLYVALVCATSILWYVGVIGGLYLKEQGGPITVGFAMKGITPPQYGLTQLGVIAHYLRLVIWPHPLVIDYGWPVASDLRSILPGALVIAVLLGLTVWLFIRRNAATFLLAAFFIILAPTSSIVPIRDIAFEHRMYLPLAAIIALLVITVHRLLQRFPTRYLSLAPIALATLVIGMGVTTFARNAAYADPVALWTDNIARSPQNPRPINALGYALFKLGQDREAEARYRQVLQLEPYNANAYANLGHLYISEHRLPEAIDAYEKALKISPDEFGVDFFSPYGVALLEIGRVDQAIKTLRTAVEFDPNYVEARYNLANALMNSGDLRSAVGEFEEVLRHAPAFAEAAVNLGLAKAAMGDPAGAAKAYERALLSARTPDCRFKAHYNMALALIRLGNNPQAAIQLQRALQIRPDHAGAAAALKSLQAAPAG